MKKESYVNRELVINVLQPRIALGNVSANKTAIAALFDRLDGHIAVLPEYCLTGSLVWLAAEQTINLLELADEATNAAEELGREAPIPILIHSLERSGDKIYNTTGLWVKGRLKGTQRKQHPDKDEVALGVFGGTEGYPIFDFEGFHFQIVICTDLRYFTPSREVDFVVWVSHYPEAGHADRIARIFRIQEGWEIPVVVASPVGGGMIGHSMVMHRGKILTELQEEPGVLSWSLKGS